MKYLDERKWRDEDSLKEFGYMAVLNEVKWMEVGKVIRIKRLR